MSRDAIKDLIVVNVLNAESGLTAGEIHELLVEQYDVSVSERTVKKELKHLTESDELIREKVPDGTPGRPPFQYYHPSWLENEPRSNKESSNESVPEDSVLETDENIKTNSIEARGEITPNKVANLPDGIVYDIVEEHLERAQLTQDLKEMAPVLAEQNPIDLLMDMVRWTVKTINEQGRKLFELLEKGYSNQLRTERDRYQDFTAWARHYWHRFWSLTAFDDPGPDYLHIPEYNGFVQAEDESELPNAEFNEKRVRDRFEKRVFGDSVLRTVKIDDSVVSAVGTDASVADISLPSEEILAPETNVQLFAGAAALQHENRRYTDFDFTPRNLRKYKHRNAFRKGLLLSKRVLPQLTEAQIEHAKWAAMDLRQYKESCRIIDEEIDWRPYGDTQGELSDWTGPDILYSDGRILPLVHQRSDFGSDSLYGELARREIRWFSKFADYAHEDDWNTDAVFAGIVKRPAFSWFAPIVFWYLETQYREDDTVDIPRSVYQPPISDVMLPHLLFVGIVQEKKLPPENEMFSTFHVLRRYYDNSIEKRHLPPVMEGDLIDVNETDHWLEYLKQIDIQAAEYGEDTIDPEKYQKYGFANLCANVGTVMCYGAPRNLYKNRPETAVRLPRLEVLVNPPKDGPEKLRKALSWYGLHNVADDEHGMEGFSATVDEVPVVVPSVIADSDRAVKYARDHINDDVGQDIRDLIRELR